jgi:hypothetical protein
MVSTLPHVFVIMFKLSNYDRLFVGNLQTTVVLLQKIDFN